MSDVPNEEPGPETDESAQRSDETHDEWAARNLAAAKAAPLPAPQPEPATGSEDYE